MVVNDFYARSANPFNDHYKDLPTFSEEYAKFPEKTKDLLGLNLMDPLEFLARYDVEDLPSVTIDPNANIGNRKSSSNRVAELAKPFLKLRGFQELYEGGIRFFGEEFSLEPIKRLRVYIHDSTKMDRPYCIGVSAMDIMNDGRPYADIEGVPPKHFDAFMGQVVEYIMNLSMEFAGAVAVSDWVVCMAWYAEKERIPMTCAEKYAELEEYERQLFVRLIDMYHEMDPDLASIKEIVTKHNLISIEQSWQHAVHILHNKYRIDGDPPYTNISLNSPEVLMDMFEHYVFPDGKSIEDILPTVMKVQETILDFMAKGDPQRGGLQYKFPVMTCNFKPWDVGTEWWEKVARANCTGKFNICHAEMFSSCCRLLSDVKRMLKYKTYSNGSGGIKVGSHRVIANNLPGLAIDTIEDVGHDLSGEDAMYWYLKYLEPNIEHVARYLFVHKIYTMMPRIANGYYTFFSQFRDIAGRPMYRNGQPLGPWLHPNMLFSTIGVHGSPEATDILLGGYHTVLQPEGEQLQYDMLRFIVDKANKLSEKYEHEGIHLFFNVEQVPAESASHTMAAFDGNELYSNQFVPADAECDIWDRVRIEGNCASILTGGSMTFLTLDRELTPEQSLKFHKRVMKASNMKLNNWCMNLGWKWCRKCNETKASSEIICPKCGDKRVPFQRPVGYMTMEDHINEPRVVNDLEKRYRNVV